MPTKGHRSITTNAFTYERLRRYCFKHDCTGAECVEKVLDEIIRTREFASTITQIPEKVERYT